MSNNLLIYNICAHRTDDKKWNENRMNEQEECKNGPQTKKYINKNKIWTKKKEYSDSKWPTIIFFTFLRVMWSVKRRHNLDVTYKKFIPRMIQRKICVFIVLMHKETTRRREIMSTFWWSSTLVLLLFPTYTYSHLTPLLCAAIKCITQLKIVRTYHRPMNNTNNMYNVCAILLFLFLLLFFYVSTKNYQYFAISLCFTSCVCM